MTPDPCGASCEPAEDATGEDAVTAGDAKPILYDGSFDLTFLREGESVEAAGDGSGACYVTQPTGLRTVHGLRVEIGQTLARLENGWLYAYSADSDSASPTPAGES